MARVFKVFPHIETFLETETVEQARDALNIVDTAALINELSSSTIASVSQLSSDIIENTSLIDDFTTDILILSTDILDNTSLIMELSGNISSSTTLLSSDILNNTILIESLSGTTTTSIDTLSSDIQGVLQSIGDIEFTYGGVFITSIEPNGEGNISDNRYTDGYALSSCFSSTDDIIVNIIALPGHTRYKPIITLNDINVPLVLSPDKPVFEGSIQYNISTNNILKVQHEDGASNSVIVYSDVIPIIQSALFVGDYPGAQTELKEDDTFSITVSSDLNTDRVEIQNYGAGKSYTITVTSGTLHTVTINIADRGNTSQSLPARIRVRKPNGTWSAWVDTSNTVVLNNTYPSINITSTTYPGSQSALKGSESAVVANNVSNFDTVQYTSPNSQLNITDPSIYEVSKTVSRSIGDYNTDVTNLVITATKSSNNAISTVSHTVKIANVAATLAVQIPGDRLRSGGNDGTDVQSYTITITSSQDLPVAPLMNTPVGSWQDAAFSGSGTLWTRRILIHDDDIKGSYSWQNISAINSAGVQTTNIQTGSTFTVGGFVERIIELPAFSSSLQIGTAVTQYTKLVLSWNVKDLPNKRPVGTTLTPDAGAWSIDALDINPTTINILDTQAANSSSQPSFITVQETN